MKTNYLELFFGKFKHTPVLCLKIFQWSRWCLKFILTWATAILHKPAVNFLSEISDYFSLSLPLFKLLRTRLPLPSPPLAPSSGTLHLHSHCGSGNRGMAPPGKSSLTTTTVLGICLTVCWVCCVLCTSNHAQIETVPPENKCISSTTSFERDTGRREENQDHENFMNLPTGRRTELVTLSPKEKRETGGKDNLVKKKVNLLCRHFRCQNRKGQRF